MDGRYFAFLDARDQQRLQIFSRKTHHQNFHGHILL
jgi:hypothetical protein